MLEGSYQCETQKHVLSAILRTWESQRQLCGNWARSAVQPSAHSPTCVRASHLPFCLSVTPPLVSPLTCLLMDGGGSRHSWTEPDVFNNLRPSSVSGWLIRICSLSKSKSGNFPILCRPFDIRNITVMKERVGYAKQRRQTKKSEEQRGKKRQNFTTEWHIKGRRGTVKTHIYFKGLFYHSLAWAGTQSLIQ